MTTTITPYFPRKKRSFTKFLFHNTTEVLLSAVILILLCIRVDGVFAFGLAGLLSAFVMWQLRVGQRNLMGANRLLSWDDKSALGMMAAVFAFALFLICSAAIRRNDYLIAPSLPFVLFGLLEFAHFRYVRNYEWR